MRLDSDVLDSFKATGEGWQTRMNEALREHLQARNMLAPRYHATVRLPVAEMGTAAGPP